MSHLLIFPSRVKNKDRHSRLRELASQEVRKIVESRHSRGFLSGESVFPREQAQKAYRITESWTLLRSGRLRAGNPPRVHVLRESVAHARTRRT